MRRCYSFVLILSALLGSDILRRDVRAGGRQAFLLRHSQDLHSIGFNADGDLLGYSSAAGVFIADDLSAMPAKRRSWPSPDKNALISGALSPDGQTSALVFEVNKRPGRLLLCDSRSGKRRDPEFDRAPVAFVAFSSDSQSLAGVGEHEIWVFDARTGKITTRMELERRSQVGWMGLEFSPNDKFLSTRNSYVSYIWDLANARLIGDTASGFYLSISPDWALAARESDIVDLKDPRSPRPLTPEFPPSVRTNLNWLAFSRNSTLVAVHTMDEKVRLWEVPTGKFLKTELSAPGRVVSMAFSADARYLAIYSKDLAKSSSIFNGRITLWEVASGRAVSDAVEVFGLLRDWHFDLQNRYLVASLSADKWATLVWELPQPVE